MCFASLPLNLIAVHWLSYPDVRHVFTTW